MLTTSSREETHLLLTIDPRLDQPVFDQFDDVRLQLGQLDPKGGGHPVQMHARERLEVLHKRSIPDLARQVGDVARQVDVEAVPALKKARL